MALAAGSRRRLRDILPQYYTQNHGQMLLFHEEPHSRAPAQLGLARQQISRAGSLVGHGDSTSSALQGALYVVLVVNSSGSMPARLFADSWGARDTAEQALTGLGLSICHFVCLCLLCLGVEHLGGSRVPLAPVLGVLGFGAAATGYGFASAALWWFYRSPVDGFVLSAVEEWAGALLVAFCGRLAWSFLATSLASLRGARVAESHVEASTAVLTALCDTYLVLSSDLQVLQCHGKHLQGCFSDFLHDSEALHLQEVLHRARAHQDEAVTVSARLAPLFGHRGTAQLCCSWFSSAHGECLYLMAIRFGVPEARSFAEPDSDLGDPEAHDGIAEQDLEAAHELTVGTSYPHAVHRTSAGLEDVLGEALQGEGFALRLPDKSERQELQQWLESNASASPGRSQRVFGPVRLQARASSWDVRRDCGDRAVTIVLTWCTGEVESSECLARLKIFVLSEQASLGNADASRCRLTCLKGV
ncbi:ADA [Symbiodinium natans]|uniref:ADA protein n=1 Tax=Symbiodinium natans TaxID=878477 RepID=A0A812R5E5_9DINO|nr:ADA [Symbiodinium natans]